MDTVSQQAEGRQEGNATTMAAYRVGGIQPTRLIRGK